MTADPDRLAAARQALAAATGSSPRGGRPASGPASPSSRTSPSSGSSPSARASTSSPPPHQPTGSDPDPATVARAIVLRQLSMGPRSRAQLERKLAQRGCAPQVATEVLDRLQEVGLVDDVAFADHLVQSRRRTKGLAGAALLVELREKGVDREVAHTAIGGLDPQTDRARAEALATRKLATMTGLDPQVQARRLAAMLTRKGYGSGTVYAVVRDVIENAPEHQRD